MPALTDKERLETAKRAHKALSKAKTAADVRKVFEHKEYGYNVLGLKILGRMVVGKTAAEATKRRGS